MAARLDPGIQEAVQAAGRGVRDHRKRGKTGDRRLSWLARSKMFDSHGDHGLALGTASFAGFAMFLAAHVAFVDLDQAAQLVALSRFSIALRILCCMVHAVG